MIGVSYWHAKGPIGDRQGSSVRIRLEMVAGLPCSLFRGTFMTGPKRVEGESQKGRL
ncbi:hypothetical protein NT2_05_00880 [Caenibius tardaugens NBRC 16725]|uniref:Uncharacterized protein n=1 Tax=Caenibius tardaugens NBRC 16725 TaxID=1219035 RepID=U2YLA6_9SPHN|nr:hypothetical protein NT2_05_00880 [Caenibius tardaugens NBRC 16725]